MHTSINHADEKVKVRRDEKGNSVQISDFLDINVDRLNNKNEISTEVYHKDTNTHVYHLESCKKNIHYNLAKRINVFVNDPWESGLSQGHD